MDIKSRMGINPLQHIDEIDVVRRILVRAASKKWKRLLAEVFSAEEVFVRSTAMRHSSFSTQLTSTRMVRH